MDSKEDNGKCFTDVERREVEIEKIMEKVLNDSRKRNEADFQNLVSGKIGGGLLTPEQDQEVAGWLKEAYEMGKEHGRTEFIKEQVLQKANGQDLFGSVQNIIGNLKKATDSGYMTDLLRYEKSVSDIRSAQVNVLLDKLDEYNPKRPFNIMQNGGSCC